MTANPDDPKFMLTVALRGSEGAHERFRSMSANHAAAEDLFVPLSEALWWTVTVDDGFESLVSQGQGQGYRPNLGDYRAARNGDPAGATLRALRYARDRCGHQRALVISVKLPTLPMTLPAVLGPVFCWRPSSDLPLPDPRFSNEPLRNEYDKLLAGRAAAAAIASAATWFNQEQARAGL